MNEPSDIPSAMLLLDREPRCIFLRKSESRQFELTRPRPFSTKRPKETSGLHINVKVNSGRMVAREKLLPTTTRPRSPILLVSAMLT